MSYKRKTLLLIAIGTLVRCLVACTIELGNDEVYYRMYAQYLQWNYFDHPPVVGWLIRTTTANLLLDSEFFIRLGAIVSAAITTWIFFLSGRKLNGEYTGFLASLIYTATLYGSIIAGIFILPDAPQMVCWSAGLYLLIAICSDNLSAAKKNQALIYFGIVAGAGMLCKIHTSFLWLGFLLYIIFYDHSLLKLPALYISCMITILFFYPVIQWNIDNHFATWLYHSKRVDVATGGLDPVSFLTFAAGQFFYCNPVIFPFIILASVAAIKNKLLIALPQKRLLLFSSLPLIAAATLISFFKNVLPHWTGPGYSGLILLTACYFAAQKRVNGFNTNAIPTALKWATALILVIITAGVLVINFLPGTLGKKDSVLLGEGDFTLDMYGWKDVKARFVEIQKKEEQAGVMKKDAIIISNKWFSAAHIDFYIAMPSKIDVVAIGDISDIHQYAWLNTKRKKLKPGDDAWCIVPSENYFDVLHSFAPLFQRSLPADTIRQKRNGENCRLFYVYKFKNYTAK